MTARTKHELIQEGQGLVRSLATKIWRSLPMKADLDDLVAYGEVGLAEAARDFDPEQGVLFTTFAYYRVRGAIYDGVSQMSWTSRARYQRMRFRRMADEVLEQESRNPGTGETALDRDASWVAGVSEKLAIIFFAGRKGEEGGLRDSTLADPDSNPASQLVAQRETVERVHELVEQLPHVERQLITAVYFEGATLKDAGVRMGISKSWASRMHAKALERLAQSLRRLGEDP
jgi:RNA polymerase sigma factor FliA